MTPFIESTLDQLSGIFALGGPIVAILAALSVLLVAVVLLKLWQFIAFGVGRHGAARRGLDDWMRGDASVPARLERSPSPTARLLVHAIRGANRIEFGSAEPALVREDIERIAGGILLDLRSHLRVLDVIAQLAPLLGLLGTVIGMIDAFHDLQMAGAQVDPSDLAGGIWVALLTTAAGLVVAMPATIMANWFESRIAREAQAMEDMATSVLTRRVTDAGPERPVGGFQVSEA